MRQYHDLLKHILAHGEKTDDRTGVGTISVFGYQTRFDLRESFPIVTTKSIPFRWIVEELLWFLSGDTNEATLRARGVDIWKEWADLEHTSRFGRDEGDLGEIYGYLWRSFGGNYPKRDGVDQIARLVAELQQNPFSRRHIVTGWDARACDRVALPPCHTLWQMKVHPNGELSCELYARSIDSFLGLPFNISSYALLTHLIAHVTDRKPRELIISFGDLHIYLNHLNQVEELLSREPLPLPTLQILDDAHRFRGLEGLLQITYKDLKLVGYRHHGKIAAPVAV